MLPAQTEVEKENYGKVATGSRTTRRRETLRAGNEEASAGFPESIP